MTRIHNFHRSPIAHTALMLLSGALLFACTADTRDDDRDDGPSAAPQSSSQCASACARVTGCGACVAVDGECISEAECISGCSEDSYYAALASCVDGASTCDAVAACFDSGSGSGSAGTCEWANDGECDEPDLCPPGTDGNDCSGGGAACEWANDGECDEPDLCPPGTDGNDCF